MTWEKELHDFLVDHFTARELKMWVRFNAKPIHPQLTGEAIAEIADSLVTHAEHHGLVTEEFFRGLVDERPQFAAEIGAIQAKKQTGAVSTRSPAGGSANRSDSTPTSSTPPGLQVDDDLTHAALVLDRIDQWKLLRERCADDDHHLVIFVHGDHEQDLDLFLKRIKLHFKDECTRRHNVLPVLRTREHSTASTALDWRDSIIAASPLRASLPDALASGARTLDALYILEDYGHPLRGLGWPDFEGLIDLFENLIPAAVEQRRPARPLRFVVPLQHDPQDAKATRKYLKDTTTALARPGGFVPLLLKELDLPTGKDFERFAVELLGPLTRPEKATLAALYKDLTDRKKNPRQTYRTLADALQGFCDRTALARDAARRSG